METALTLYQGKKIELKNRLNRVAEDFCAIGFILKEIKREVLYAQDGYMDINDFAKQEYNLSATSVSRFMALNDEFSIDGNSLELKDEYKEYGSARLQEMLNMSVEERKLITETTPRDLIREYKADVRENKLNPPEEPQEEKPLAHAQVSANTDRDNVLRRIVTGMFSQTGKQKIRHKQLIQIGKVIASNHPKEAEKISEIANPSGNDTFSKFPLYIFIYDYKRGIKYKQTIPKVADVVNEVTWEELVQVIKDTFDMSCEDPWLAFFGQEEPDPNEIKKPEPSTTQAKATISNSKPTVKPPIKPPVKQAEKKAPPEPQLKGQIQLPPQPEDDDIQEEENMLPTQMSGAVKTEEHAYVEGRINIISELEIDSKPCDARITHANETLDADVVSLGFQSDSQKDVVNVLKRIFENVSLTDDENHELRVLSNINPERTMILINAFSKADFEKLKN